MKVLVNKKSSIVLLTLMFIISICVGLFVLHDTSRAGAESPTTVAMVDGASIRLSEDKNGLRFSAQVTNYNADYDYGMIIVPSSYLSAVAGVDYVAEFEQAETKIINLTGIQPALKNGTYVYSGVISNVKYTNMALDFVGIAYFSYGNTRTYATIDNGKNIRSLATVANLALSQPDLSIYTEDEFAILCSYKYKADCLEQGISEVEALDEDTVSRGMEMLTELHDTSLLASYDYAGYDDYVVTAGTTKTGLATLTKEVLTAGYADSESGVLKLSASSTRGGVGLKFRRPVTVAANTVIKVKLYATTDELRPTTFNNTSETDGLKFFYASKLNQWIEKSFKATELGYSVGDTMEGLDLFIKNGDVYIDEITVGTMPDLVSDLHVDGDYAEVANFNCVEYEAIQPNENKYYRGDVISDEGRKVLYTRIDSGITSKINLADPIKVDESSKIILSVKTTALLNVVKKNGDNATFNAATYNNLTYDLVNDLGYSVDDVVSSVSFKNLNGTEQYIYIDTISLKAGPFVDKLAENEVMNFGISGAESYVVGFDNDVNTIVDGAFKRSGEIYTPVQINFAKDITVSANDFIVLTIAGSGHDFKIYKANGTSFWALFDDNDGSDGEWSYKTTNGTFKTALVPLSYMGYEVGSTINHIKLANWRAADDYILLKKIEIVNLKGIATRDTAVKAYAMGVDTWNDVYDGLGENEVMNFGISGAENYVVGFDNNVNTIVDGAFKRNGEVYTPVQINFAKDITVSANDFIVLTIAGSGHDFKIYKANGTSFWALFDDNDGSDGEWSYKTTNGTFKTALVPLNYLGYEVGSTINHIKLANWRAADDYILLKKIEIVNLKGVATRDTAVKAYAMGVDTWNDVYDSLGENEVINFTTTVAQGLVTYGEGTGSFTDGIFTYTAPAGAINVNVDFVVPQTVKAGDYVVLKIRSNGSGDFVKLGNKSGGFYWFLDTPDTADWVYPVGTSTMLTAIVPVIDKLGYSAGDIISRITLQAQSGRKFYLQSIEYVNLGTDPLTEAQAIEAYNNL